MAFHSSLARFLAFLLLCFCVLLSTAHGSRKMYIVYMGERKHDDHTLVTASHHDMLTTILGSEEAALDSIAYSYKHGFSGFAAMLTEEQAEQLADLPEVISVTPNREHELMTTRSWDFLGMNYHQPQPNGLLQRSNYGEDIIIGIIDSGIWPESRSFSDHGYGPVPARWKGVCQLGQDWGPSNCSRKIIGARYYAEGLDKASLNDYMSARDMDGHGTHVASTAAGAVVEGVSLHGLGAGVARGGAPRARIAVYKAGWKVGTDGVVPTAAFLAALDDAIHDGVDVLSLSIITDENSFGALHAVQKGITVVYAGGNFGPRSQIVSNTAPWVLTVAASTIDRSFPTAITLGNNQTLVGQSLYYKLNESGSSFKTIFYGAACSKEALNGSSIKGKVVLCTETDYGTVKKLFPSVLSNVVSGGASGLIYSFYTTDILIGTEDCIGIACVFVDLDIGFKIVAYITSQSLPVAKIEPASTVVGKQVLAPKVAMFSSRGPSIPYPTVLKPDIAAPGANILAATKDSYKFNSGTSMATPHVAGIVALLKAIHPQWSHAALKSAIVTTASTVDDYGMPILAEGLPRKVADPFDYGGGHINPNGAADPGLVYDIDPRDYNKFFTCQLEKRSASCNATTLPAYHLNLPSIAIPDLRHPINVRREVTNVGKVDAVYKSVIQSPAGVKMSVEPSLLVFNATNKVNTFKVNISPLVKVQGDYTFGSLTWYNEHHTVRIPIAVRITIHDFYADVA